MGGTVKNKSSKNLWVVENGIEPNTYPAIAHILEPGYQSPDNIDADGVKAVDGTPISDYSTWWKVTDWSTADIEDDASNLKIDCLLCTRVPDNEFGPVTYKQGKWGVRIPRE